MSPDSGLFAAFPAIFTIFAIIVGAGFVVVIVRLVTGKGSAGGSGSSDAAGRLLRDQAQQFQLQNELHQQQLIQQQLVQQQLQIQINQTIDPAPPPSNPPV